ncbi:peptidase M48-like protein [Ectopseudomonas oleovorans]|uniref:Peptidase M48-like protein n=1 Tax=Ectopseudomonas oleovorans TaxID=301 RepID=A0A397M235_ECTOL|nr:M48 family metallopeptidase [Pseudomonas oleovorans]RIA19252.1 peptidase M48-like protein [Pseudomonas oleovorans]
MRKEMVLAVACLSLFGCQQMPTGSKPPLEGKFIDSPRARPLALQPMTNNPWLNNALVDRLAGAADPDEVRGFGKLDLTEQMAQVESFQVPQLQTYCDQVLGRLLAHWPHTKPDIKVRFSASESFGARATVDNVIYLNLGTLQAIESEDELAAMLGHEAAHMLLGHLDREHFFNQQKKLLDASVTAVSLGATLAGLESQKSGTSRKLVVGNPDAVGKTIVQSSLSGTLLKAVSDNFWNSSWTRAQEDEADLLSVDLLSRAGYSPRGAVHGIQRLQSFEGSNVSQLQRYQAQQKQLFSQAIQKKGVSGLLEQGIQSGVTAAQLAAVDVWKDFGKTHQLPAQREEALARYIASEYRSERRRSPQLASYQRQLLGGQSGKVLAGQVLINRATKAIYQGDLNEARRLAREVAQGPAAKSMRAQTLQFVLAVQQRRYKDALANLEQVPDSEWQYASLSSYDQIITLSLSLDRQAQAERYLQRGQVHWGNQLMAPLEISVHLQGERIVQAQQAYQSCLSSTSKGLLAQCESAIGRFKPQQQAPANPLEQLGLPSIGKLLGS